VIATSLASCQRSLGPGAATFALWPPLTAGCPLTSSEAVSYPVEVGYDHERVPADFAVHRSRWTALLPPLLAPGLGEGRTPLVEIGGGVFVKDESRNPTWSHKDRLNRCTVSAAIGARAEGIVVASSGNAAASAAAYAARAGLRCVVLISAGAPAAVSAFVNAYGAIVLTVPALERWRLLRRIVDEFGLHPVSNMTPTHTGHPFGSEGYKPIAYEIFAELGVPGAVFVPTGYGELLFGIWKGFDELRRIGAAAAVPTLYSCEPAAGGPLARAVADGVPAARVTVGPTDAYAIACPVGGYRGVVALRESGGLPLLVSDNELASAQRELAAAGLWQELSGTAGLAGLRQLCGQLCAGQRGAGQQPGPVVCVATSSGFKDRAVGASDSLAVDSGWDAVRRRLLDAGLRIS
jgi:threonine synthase